MSSLAFPLHLFTYMYVMGLRAIIIVLILSVPGSEYNVFTLQILTSKDGLRADRVKGAARVVM